MILTCSNPGLELAVLGNPGRKVIKYDWTGVPPSKRALASLGRLVRRVKGRVTRENSSGTRSGQRLTAVKTNPRRRRKSRK